MAGGEGVRMDSGSLIFDTGAATHVGLVRSVNEDGHILRPGIGLWAVSDGMGGHEGGRMASSIVVERLATVEPNRLATRLLHDCEMRLVEANRRMREIGTELGVDTIGATVVLLLLHGSSYACVWAGDSRIYRIRGGAIEQLTRDHSEAEELISQGIMSREQARTWPRRNVITRAIGVAETPEIEVVDGLIQEGDTYVLCSDGLTNHVRDDEIAEIGRGTDAQVAADRLVELTLSRGAKDNVTVVVVRAQARETTVVDLRGPARGSWAKMA